MLTIRACGASAAFLFFATAQLAAQDLVLLTRTNRLLTIDTGAPGTLLSSVPITGMLAAESMLGIDFRPATGELYALSNLGWLYTVDPTTGAATRIGGGLGQALTGTSFGFDFNPTVDRIRITSDAGMNLRAHPVTGAAVAVDGPLAFGVNDVNGMLAPNCVASAYTNNVGGATSTVLYNIDSRLDLLVSQVPPNAGTLNTIGRLGVNAGSVAGFDVAGTTGTAYAVFASPGPGVTSSSLFTIDLATGAATFVSTIAGGEVVTGMSVLPTPGAVQFGAATPGCAGSPAIGVLSSPRVGNAAFGTKCVSAQPQTAGFMVAGYFGLPTPVLLFGASTYIDPYAPDSLFWPATTDIFGNSSFSIPVPAHQGLAGLTLFLQYGWMDPCTLGGFSASNAMRLTIQP